MMAGCNVSLKQPCHVIMYSLECTSSLTQHTGCAISDYHIHNSVCMFELPPSFGTLSKGCHPHARVERGAAFSVTRKTGATKGKEKKKKTATILLDGLPPCGSLSEFVTSAAEREESRKEDPSQSLCEECRYPAGGSGSLTSLLLVSQLSQFYLICTDCVCSLLQHGSDSQIG